MSNCKRCNGEGFPRFARTNGGACFACGARPFGEVDPGPEPLPQRMSEAATAAKFGHTWDTVLWLARTQRESPTANYQAGALMIDLQEGTITDPAEIDQRLDWIGNLYFKQCDERAKALAA